MLGARRDTRSPCTQRSTPPPRSQKPNSYLQMDPQTLDPRSRSLLVHISTSSCLPGTGRHSVLAHISSQPAPYLMIPDPGCFSGLSPSNFLGYPEQCPMLLHRGDPNPQDVVAPLRDQRTYSSSWIDPGTVSLRLEPPLRFE